MKSIYLETERLILREMDKSEVSFLFELDSDPAVMKYLSDGKPTSMDVCERAMKRICEYYQVYNKKYGIWIAEEKETGDGIGWFLLRPDKEKPEDIMNPELGYRFKKKFWGKGYATEGALALVQKAFEDFDCNSVFAIALAGNEASQNVMKKIGMKYIGEFQQDECVGPCNDPSAVHYAITKKEWLSR